MVKGEMVAAVKKLIDKEFSSGGGWKSPEKIKISKKRRKMNTKKGNK